MDKYKIKNLTSSDIDRIIALAWEDEVPFRAIKFQYNILEKDVIKIISENKNISEKKIELLSKKKVIGSFIFSGSEEELIENLQNQKIKIRKQNNSWDIYYNEWTKNIPI